jgi:hypothetical protein
MSWTYVNPEFTMQMMFMPHFLQTEEILQKATDKYKINEQAASDGKRL